MLTKLLRITYASVALKGLLTAIAPRRVLGLVFKTWSVSLENTDQLEPRDWYVSAVRATGVGMLAAGGVGLLLLDDDVEGDDDSPDFDDEDDDSDRTDDDGVEPIDISPDE